MKLLLDTCSFLWIITGAPELSENARNLFTNPENQVFLSSISIWEILVKFQLKRLPLPKPPSQFLIEQRKLHRIESLPLHESDTLHLINLPNSHRDPFDRMLVCQAIVNGLTILTPDQEIKEYPVNTLW